MQLSTALGSAASLVVGFAVADVTGVRALGGVVLVAGAAWCARRWNAEDGPRTAALLLGAGLAAFVLAHVFALGVGTPAYPTVLVLAAVDAAVVVAKKPARLRQPA